MTSAPAWPVPSYRNALAALLAMRELAGQERRLGVLVGEAGSGKSFVVRDLAHSDSTVAICTVPSRDLCTPKALLVAVAESLGLRALEGYVTASVFYYLRRGMDGRFLVVDEADRLNANRLDLLRDLAEGSQAPICLCGTPALEAVVARLAPVASRVALRHVIRPVSAEEVLAVIGPGAEFARQHGLRTWERPVLAAAVAESRGNLRQLQVLLAQIDLLERGGAVPQGKSDAFKVALVHRVAEEFLFRAA